MLEIDPEVCKIIEKSVQELHKKRLRVRLKYAPFKKEESYFNKSAIPRVHLVGLATIEIEPPDHRMKFAPDPLDTKYGYHSSRLPISEHSNTQIETQQSITQIIKQKIETCDMPSIDFIYDWANEKTFNKKEVDLALQVLLDNGEIYVPMKGYIKRVKHYE